MGVADRARKRMPAQGDYLEKDDLIRKQDEPFGVVSVVYDERGGQYGPRWVLVLIPWFEDQEDPHGLLTFTANPTRNPFFEDLQVQIEENENQPIGPLTVVKGKSQKGFRYYTLDDWTEDGPANGPAPEDVSPAPAPARPSRPSAPAPQQEAAVDVPPASVPANETPAKRRPGRPRKATPTSATTSAPSSTTTSSAPSIPATREPGPGEAAQAQQTTIPRIGTAICPNCKQEVTGRILSDEQGRHVIIHPFCPTTNKPEVVEFLG